MQMCVFSFLYVRLLCFIDSSVLIATLGGGGGLGQGVGQVGTPSGIPGMSENFVLFLETPGILD